jgi:hypothetical protein
MQIKSIGTVRADNQKPFHFVMALMKEVIKCPSNLVSKSKQTNGYVVVDAQTVNPIVMDRINKGAKVPSPSHRQ